MSWPGPTGTWQGTWERAGQGKKHGTRKVLLVANPITPRLFRPGRLFRLLTICKCSSLSFALPNSLSEQGPTYVLPFVAHILALCFIHSPSSWLTTGPLPRLSALPQSHDTRIRGISGTVVGGAGTVWCGGPSQPSHSPGSL